MSPVMSMAQIHRMRKSASPAVAREPGRWTISRALCFKTPQCRVLMLGAVSAQELLSLRDALVEKDNELASLRLRSLQVAERVGTAPAAARKTQREGEGADWACLGP